MPAHCFCLHVQVGHVFVATKTAEAESQNFASDGEQNIYDRYCSPRPKGESPDSLGSTVLTTSRSGGSKVVS